MGTRAGSGCSHCTRQSPLLGMLLHGNRHPRPKKLQYSQPAGVSRRQATEVFPSTYATRLVWFTKRKDLGTNAGGMRSGAGRSSGKPSEGPPVTAAESAPAVSVGRPASLRAPRGVLQATAKARYPKSITPTAVPWRQLLAPM